MALLGLAALALAVRLYFGPLLRDDAYITFKYARNLAQGAGFVFNPGEPVLGTTTPLYTIILATLYRLGISPLEAGYVLGIASDVALVGLLGWSLTRWSKTRLGEGRPGAGLLAAAFYALSAPLATAAVSGMETSFYLLLGWLGLYLYTQERYSLSALALALMALTRPDGLILAAVIAGDYAIRHRRLPWRSLALFAALLAPWIAFATLYFGSPIPQSMMAKASTAAQANPWLSLRLFGEYFIQGPMALGSLLFLVGAATTRSRPFGLLLAWFGAYAILFIGANQFSNPVFEWYYAPLLLGFCVMAGQGAAFLLGAVARVLSRPVGYPAIAALGLVFLLASANLLEQRRQTVSAWVDSREGGYRRMAGQLNQWAGPGELLAAREVGVLGYYYQGPLLDLDGLVSPQAVGQTDAELIKKRRPAWISGIGDHLAWELLTSAWFTDNYALEDNQRLVDGRDLYAWRQRSPSEIPSWHPVGAQAWGVVLEAYSLEPPITRPGGKARLTLRWRAPGGTRNDYGAFGHLVGPGGVSLGADKPLLPTHQGAQAWPTSGIVYEQRLIELPPDAAPGVYALEVGLYRQASGDFDRAIWADDTGRSLGNGLWLPGVVVKREAALRVEDISPAQPLHEVFGGQVTLLGVDLPPQPWPRGTTAPVTLYWQALISIPGDYTVFVHVADTIGYVVAQDDAPPEQGQNPTRSWSTGEVVADGHSIAVPSSLPPGTYQLKVGLYDEQGRRLTLPDGRDEVSLGAVVLE